MSKASPNLPWHILVPIVLVMGLGMTVWGAAHLLSNGFGVWQMQNASLADRSVAKMGSSWQQMTGQLAGLRNLISYSDSVQPDRFHEAAEYIHSTFPYVESLHYMDAKGGVLSHPEGSSFKHELGLKDVAAISEKIKGGEGRRVLVLASDQLHLRLYLPVKNGDNQAFLIYKLKAEEFLEGFYEQLKKSGAALRLTIMDEASNELFNKSVVDAESKGYELFNYDYDKTVKWGGVDWLFSWHFPFTHKHVSNLYPGLTILAVGLIMTLAIGWVFWSQHSISKRIRQQVVERTNKLAETSRMFKLITDNAYDLISIFTIDGEVDYVNSAYHRVLGYAREELKGRDITEFIHPKDLEAFKTTFNDVAKGRAAAEVTFRMKHKKGRWLYLEAVAKGLHDNNWDVNGVVMHCRDITSRKMYADELARSEQRFRDFADSSADWLWEVGRENEFNYVSQGIKGTLGHAPEEVIGRMSFEDLFDKETDPTHELIESRIQRHQPYRDIEFWTRAKNGERVCLRISGVPIFDEKGIFLGYRGAATNITASKIDRENMFRLATTDHLTGLLNRNRFMEELERTVSLSRRHKTKGVLMFIDLDRFKEVNDTHGHDAGDAILTAVSDILKKSVRGTDVVARLGGDEFAIIMHNITPERAQEKVQKIIDEINGLKVDYQGARLNVTMSIGMVTYPQEGSNSANLIMSADMAMYRAKDMGRNRLYVDAANNTEVKQDSVREQLKWVDYLRKALDTGDFEMYYQPIIPMKNSDRPFFEALLRIYDEDGKLGSPAIFIDAAEHFGLIQQLDLKVVERCIVQQLEMKKSGIDFDVSINLSARSLGDPELIEKLHEVVGKYEDLNPSNFTFEVTETAALHDPSALRDIELIKDFITELKSMGFRFALDDFGVGFSSFNYLRKLDLDLIKIDGSFIKDITHSEDDRMFVEAISSLAKGLGVQTVAEFVEDEEIVKVLQDVGVDYIQGYHVSRPEGDIEDLYNKFGGKRVKDFLTMSANEKKAGKVKKKAG